MDAQKVMIWMGLCLLLPLVAAAQTAPQVQELVRRGAEAGLDPLLLQGVESRLAAQEVPTVSAVALLTPAVALAEQGLPAEPVLRKVLEGLAKRVPSTRVAGVLERMQLQTEHAGRMVDPWIRRSEVRQLIPELQGGSRSDEAGAARGLLVENLAQAFLQEVPAATAQVLLDRLPQQVQRSRVPAAEVAAAIGILADLPTARQEPEVTAQLVAAALDAGYSPADLRQLPLAVRAAEERGQMPADVVAREAAAQIAGGTPAAVLLNSLFQGGFPGRSPGGLPPGLDKTPDRGPGGPPTEIPPGSNPRSGSGSVVRF